LAVNLAQVATQLRVARPTDRLEAVLAFYRDGLGLEELGSFTGHDGYDGVMLGLPEGGHHLEFTRHVDGSPCPAPSRDNLLVFYVPDPEARTEVAERLTRLGHAPVAAENPYWEKIEALTFEDPDGWRVVLAPTSGI
jgi:catechol 2,3-dioxygenase-like lactoylglutathione lyase family enzyme